MAKCSVCGCEFKVSETFSVYEYQDIEFPVCRSSICNDVIDAFDKLTDSDDGNRMLAMLLTLKYVEANIVPDLKFDGTVKIATLMAFWLIWQDSDTFGSTDEFRARLEQLKKEETQSD